MPAVSKVAVLGATGQQGSSVLKALLNKGISVVAITRDPDSSKAKDLAALPNTAVKKADLNDVNSLVEAFRGCDGAFIIANFWEGMNAAKEMEQYKNATDALRQVGTVKHVVFSTLEESNIPINEDFKTLEEHPTGDMKVPHFDGKARAEKYFEGLPTTFMVTSCYFENFTSFFSFAKQDDNSYTFTLPLGDKKIPWTISSDIGLLVASTFGNADLIGKRIGQASFLASGQDLADIFSKATGKVIKYNCVDWKTYASFGFPGASEMAQMFELWLRTYDDFCRARSLDEQEKIIGYPYSIDPVEYAKTLPLKFDV
jgi:uncharacterized protein YbjT (DUF2867 family)